MDERDYKAMNKELNPPLQECSVRRSYKAGMMQAFRMLQSYMSFQQQKEFGILDNPEKINKILENAAEKWFKDNYA